MKLFSLILALTFTFVGISDAEAQFGQLSGMYSQPAKSQPTRTWRAGKQEWQKPRPPVVNTRPPTVTFPSYQHRYPRYRYSYPRNYVPNGYYINNYGNMVIINQHYCPPVYRNYNYSGMTWFLFNVNP